MLKIFLNFEATAEKIEEMHPDILVIAIGSEHELPEVPGIENQNVLKAVDVLTGRVDVGERVLILGGGRVGCETALHLAEGRDVTILEALPEVAMNLERNYRFALIRELRKKNVKWICNFRAERVSEKSIVGYSDGKRIEVELDNLIIATGMRVSKIEG